MEWTQEQNLRKEEERIWEPKEEEENAREKAKIGTIWNFLVYIHWPTLPVTSLH